MREETPSLDIQFDTQLPIPEEKEEEKTYRSPIPIGASTVDLSDPANEEAMQKEYSSWRNLPIDHPDKDALEQQWYQKYYGMDSDTFEKEKKKWRADTFRSNLGKRIRHDIEAQLIPVAGVADFIGDSLATIVPGYRAIDDKWDQVTKFENKHLQVARDIAGIVIPSLYGGSVIGGSKVLAATKMAKAGPIQRALLYGGLDAGMSGLIVGLSDQGYDPNLPALMAEWYPETFGTGGTREIPTWLRTMDGDSPAIRKLKSMFIDAGLSFAATGIGSIATLLPGRKSMGWFIPKDDAAKTYKAKEIAKEADPDKLRRLEELDKRLAEESFIDEPEYEQLLMDEKMTIEGELDEIEDLGDYYRRDEVRKDREQKIAAIRKTADPEQLELDFGFDPDVTPNILDESTRATSVPPEGQVARNMADVTAIENGTSTGDPAPILTEAFVTKGMKLEGGSRDAVMGVAAEARDIGDFDAIVDGFRYTKKQMTAAAWDIYTTIVDPKVTADDLKELFLDSRDIKQILNGRIKVRPVNEETFMGMAFALDELSKTFLGTEVTEASARMIKTVGKEITTLAETMLEFKPIANWNRLMDLTIPKMEFLMNEIALNKFIAGWQLNNKKWYIHLKPENIDEAIENLTADFNKAAKAIYKKNKEFAKTLMRLKDDNPKLLQPLAEAFSITKGDVDTIEKLNKWAYDQLTPIGFIRSPNPKEMNLFAKGVWGVTMNNVLSGKSTLRAAGAAVYDLTLKPLTRLTGSLIWNLPQGRWDKVQRTMYANGAFYETNVRALSFAYDLMKKAHKNPEELLKAARKDLVIVDKKKFAILDKMVSTWEKEGNVGKLIMYNMSKLISDMSLHPALRIGTTGLTFPDQFTNSTMATYVSRLRAYDDVFSEFGYGDKLKIKEAEALNYTKAFDPNNRLKDKAAAALAGEVNLNLDDEVSNWLNEATTAWPILKTQFMFPRTQNVGMRKAFSWLPISGIPESNKYSKTIWARTEAEKAAALAEHRIDYYTDPNAEALFEEFKYEYTGRVAFGGLFIGTLWQWAMAGNCNGNGHYNPAQRRKDRDTFGKVPLTCKIPGTNKWISVKGLPGIQEIVGIVGDLAMYIKDTDEAFLDNIHKKLTAMVALTFANNTLFGSLEPLLQLMTGNERAINNSFAKFLNATVTPGSGGVALIAKAYDNALKDLDGTVKQYYMNRIPGINKMLPTSINPVTGLPVREEVGFLGLANVVMPYEVYTEHQGNEEITRVMDNLYDMGWPGLSRTEMHTSGFYKWEPWQRQELNKIIGKGQWWKEADRIISKPEHQRDIEVIKRHHRKPGPVNQDQITLKLNDLPVMIELRRSWMKRIKAAEIELLSRPDFEGVQKDIIDAQLARDAMNKGLPNKAIDIKNRNKLRNTKEQNMRKLLEMPNK